MDKKIFKSIMDQVAIGKLDKKLAVEILKSLKEQDDKETERDIAIIGMDVRLPKADNVDEYWNNIRNNRNCIDDFPENRVKEVETYVNYVLNKEEKAKYYKAAYINHVSGFDYEFFGISPKEASLLDPGQRLLLETTYHAIEDAGYNIDELKGKNTGVFIGLRTDSTINYEKMCNDYNSAYNEENLFVGNINSIMAGRISYMFDFRGPCMVIDTACSSSLVGLHTACQSIINHECDQAIVGTVRILLLPFETDETIGIESKDNKTRSFDNYANGTAWGEGVISLLVKRLDLAELDHDNIYAVIKTSAINQDGKSMAITAPNVEAQKEVILEAWNKGHINPESIKYLEAHGTGTVLGDPIEVESATDAFRKYTNRKQFCAIGSVKTNIGHLDNAAGLASVVKVAKAMQYRIIPSSNNFERPNNKISFENSPVYFADNNTSVDEKDTYTAAINSFGMSGTNCHMVLQEYQNKLTPTESMIEPYLLVISAKSKNALVKLVQLYYDCIKNAELDEVRDICYTSSVCRKHYNDRVVICADSQDELQKNLFGYLNKEHLRDNVYSGFYRVVSESKRELVEGDVSVSEILEFTKQANEICKKLETAPITKEETAQLCRLFVKGADIKWKCLFSKGRKKKVPFYPFDEKVCWVNFDSIYKEQQIQNMLYNLRWVEERSLYDVGMIGDGTVLLVGNTRESLKGLLNWYQERDIVVYTILLREREEEEENYYHSDGTEESFIHIFGKFVEHQRLQITYLVEKQDHVNKNILDHAVLDYISLIKALHKQFARKNIDLHVLTKYAFSVTGKEESLSYSNSMVIGVTKALAYENRKIKSRCIDYDDETLVNNVQEEFHQEKGKFLCAFRKNKRYVQQLNRGLSHAPKNMPAIRMKDGGVYIITGGTGGIGLEIAEWLTEKAKVNIILLSRHGIPKKIDLSDSAIDDNFRYQVRKLSAIRKKSMVLECIACDITDKEKLTDVLNDIRVKHGTIDGIFHCAGIPGDGFLFKKTKEEFSNVIMPKVLGTYLIDRLTREDKLDFMVLFSSCLSITGAPGQSDYTAANSFLDSYASYRQKYGQCTVCINWTAWKETGMAVRNDYTEDGLFRSINTEDAILCLNHILESGSYSAIVSEIDTENESFKKLSNQLNIGEDVRLSAVAGSNEVVKKMNRMEKHEVVLAGNIDNEYNEYEILVGNIWSEVLGINEFNINDSFFDLGGHSLIVIQMLELLEQKGIVIDESQVYSNNTIRTLAKVIQ